MVSEMSRRKLIRLTSSFVASSTLTFFLTKFPTRTNAKSANKLTKLNFDLTAPEFEIPDLKGKVYKTDDFSGKILLISFWASWCPPCRKELPSLARLSRKLPKNKFASLAINLGDPQHIVKNFLSKIDHQGLLVLHSRSKNIMAEWHIQGLPSSYLIAPNGQIKYAVLGDIDWDSEEHKNKILKLSSAS